jgi:DNA-binding NarL/FixJ family response regulator
MAPTLLIVDDHAGFRAFARALLETGGFVVVGEAASGEAALRAARALRPEVVLLDVVLPGLDGFAVCASLAAEDPAPAVVLTSSRDASAYRRRLQQSRARGFISKSDLTGAALAALVR